MLAVSLADAMERSIGAERAAPPSQVPACGHLPDCLNAEDWHDADLRDPAAAIFPDLNWRTRLASRIGDGFESLYAAAEILGPEGIVPTDACRFGVFLLRPGVFYPPHSHEAEELYLVLSGTADWQKGEDAFAPLPPGGFTHHRSWESHATRSGDEPLLALWGWGGNIGMTSYRMDDTGG